MELFEMSLINYTGFLEGEERSRKTPIFSLIFIDGNYASQKLDTIWASKLEKACYINIRKYAGFFGHDDEFLPKELSTWLKLESLKSIM